MQIKPIQYSLKRIGKRRKVNHVWHKKAWRSVNKTKYLLTMDMMDFGMSAVRITKVENGKVTVERVCPIDLPMDYENNPEYLVKHY